MSKRALRPSIQPDRCKSISKCSHPCLPFPVVRGQVHEYANTSHAFALLRARRMRPSGRATQKSDELSPVRR
jgi:hypothetical protein